MELAIQKLLQSTHEHCRRSTVLSPTARWHGLNDAARPKYSPTSMVFIGASCLTSDLLRKIAAGSVDVLHYF